MSVCSACVLRRVAVRVVLTSSPAPAPPFALRTRRSSSEALIGQEQKEVEEEQKPKTEEKGGAVRRGNAEGSASSKPLTHTGNTRTSSKRASQRASTQSKRPTNKQAASTRSTSAPRRPRSRPNRRSRRSPSPSGRATLFSKHAASGQPERATPKRAMYIIYVKKHRSP